MISAETSTNTQPICCQKIKSLFVKCTHQLLLTLITKNGVLKPFRPVFYISYTRNAYRISAVHALNVALHGFSEKYSSIWLFLVLFTLFLKQRKTFPTVSVTFLLIFTGKKGLRVIIFSSSSYAIVGRV